MKSRASSETSWNASSSKSYLAMVTLAIVSTSVSPMNGDKPDNLLSVVHTNKNIPHQEFGFVCVLTAPSSTLSQIG